MKRKILYVSGTRADFGLLASTLDSAARHPHLDVSVCATGMHLLAQFGNTVQEIEASGLRLCARVPVSLADDSGASMVKAIGGAIIGIADVLIAERPDLVLVLGDRGEMLAATLAAIHLGMPVAHIHGGERSGTIDEGVRHAISKLAHFHFVATPESKERLVRMGESTSQVHVTGAPGLDGLKGQVTRNRAQLCAAVSFDVRQRLALLVYHPVVQDAHLAGGQANHVVNALRQSGFQVVCILPNADAGNAAIRQRFVAAESADFRTFAHLPRSEFVSWMAAADLMVGNSSSGIIEAASFNLPVVNIGDRQALRERSANVVDCEPLSASIESALQNALTMRGAKFTNIYGDGRAGDKIVSLLAAVSLDPAILKKRNAY